MKLCRALLCTVLIIVVGCGSSEQKPAPPAGDSAAPWQRTEEREPCANFDLLRSPYFGDLHIHTAYSADAYIFGTRALPRDAYRFARGETILASDANEMPTRSVQIDRPLDFAAVTDHSEFIGEVQLCITPGSLLYDDEMCEQLRQPEPPNERAVATVFWLYPAGIPDPPPSHTFCLLPGVDCDAAAVSVWQDMQAAAEGAYDRSDACSFTTFIGYEHTASPIGRHLHRNVIFRNHHVLPVPASQLETARDGIPQGVWTAIERDCLNAGEGCDAVIIPHNSNLSGGMQFVDPADGAEAQRRQDREPLVEIFQTKGNSECRFDRLAAFGLQTEDELCTFEQLRESHQGPDELEPPPIDSYPARNMVRNALKEGLRFEELHGANPFQYGFIGSTDTHDATSGNVDEDSWEGAQGNSDATPAGQISSGILENPGGLAVVWAEENSRDAVFSALRRRETYATSGSRPIVRFYGGGLTGVDCSNAAFVANAYKRGAPMGGEIGAVRGDASPRFAVLAVKDAGTDAHPGTDLQRIQIVKGWVDADGQTHERVFDVIGDADNGASVDPQTCAPVGEGARELCTVWEDPEFNRAERAFYYARVLENPRCRWSTIVCKNAGVDPFAPDCAAQASQAGNAFADCCLKKEDDAFFEPVIQERAWTSPIWYRPESIARVRGGVSFGTQAGADVLDVTISIGRVPAEVDIEATDITVNLTDSDEIYGATFAAGTMQSDEPGRFVLADDAAEVLGLRTATFEIDEAGEGVLHLQTNPRDLGAAERVDHMMRVELHIGSYRASHTRLWEARNRRLAPVEE